MSAELTERTLAGDFKTLMNLFNEFPQIEKASPLAKGVYFLLPFVEKTRARFPNELPTISNGRKSKMQTLLALWFFFLQWCPWTKVFREP